jgi:uncharacterized C2H2 Zn-finger protein
MALGKTARERRINGPKPVHVHGTWNGYNNWGCRCDKCLEACRSTYDYAAAWRRVNRAELNDKQRERRQKKRLDN